VREREMSEEPGKVLEVNAEMTKMMVFSTRER
jgi:hypothetical protein